MAISLARFVQQIEETGIIAGDTLKDFVPPRASPKDAIELARELIRQKKLTKFQAEEVSKGKGKSLVLGNYVLIDQIGAGGMGQVFKAEHRRMKRIVAIKLLPADLTRDKASIARFEREVEAAAKISHPNIVAAHDADCANGIHFLVMELIEGSDLSALVKKNGPLSVGKTIKYILQAATGLDAAHKKGIVHRDIKPANLLVSTDGTVKILDMGLARLNGELDAPQQAELTSTGAVMGTVDYMAPEQALNTKSADARADIYSLGCTLYYLLTGKAAYEGDSLMARLLAHRDHPIPSLRTIRPDVPEPLEDIFTKLVAKKVEDRYQSMAEVIADLESCGPGVATSVSFKMSTSTQSSKQKSLSFNPSAFEPTVLSNPVPKGHRALKTSRKKSVGFTKKQALIGAAFLGLAILAGIIVSLRTKDGTLVVEVDQPDASVQVLDAEGKIEVSQKSGHGTISISVDPGKHRLKVEKAGFTIFGQDFEMQSGGQTPIKAKLVPLEEKPLVTEVTPAAVDGGTHKPLAFTTPGFEQWEEKTARLPAEQQLEEVRKKLMELNLGFDGKVEPEIKAGVVTGLGFLADDVWDISPVSALTNLSSLSIHGSGGGQGKPVDISPLKGLPLTSLFLHYTQVSDLSPLKGMKLSTLSVAGTQVSDLSPLNDMPLTYLQIEETHVSDLSPLRGMKLISLNMNDTRVSDLSPLSGMPLTVLRCQGCRFTDLSPLKGTKLEGLYINGTRVADLSPLKGMPLQELCLTGPYNQRTLVTDLSPLAEMPLRRLQLDFKPGWDISCLRAIKTLEAINDKPPADFCDQVEHYNLEAHKRLAFEASEFDQWVQQTAALPAEEQVIAVSTKLVELNPGFDGKVRGADEGSDAPIIVNGSIVHFGFLTDHVTDISPIRALKSLSVLDLHGSSGGQGRLINLSPLKGLPLVDLSIYFTQVSDLSPLQGMQLTSLHGLGTFVVDLTPLQGMPLKFLDCSSTIVHDITPLRGLPLESIRCSNTLVSDLSPLWGMKLTDLSCYSTQVTDFSLLQEMPLKTIQFDFVPEKDTGLLRSIRTLEYVNTKPVAEFWKEVEEQQKEKPPLAFTTPEFDLWVKQVVALPAETQLEEVRKKLVELNPGFDGKLMVRGLANYPIIENGAVTRIEMETDHVTDISPVRVFQQLTCLTVIGSQHTSPDGRPYGTGVLSDLSPLKGLRLTVLGCALNSDLSDISPLEGMPLTHLACQNTKISDLSPLKGMPLNRLYFSITPVSDLSPLKGMKLESLECYLTEVADLSLLKGMPLINLHCYHTKVADLSPLHGMPLENLTFWQTPVNDLSPLMDMNLTRVGFTPSHVTQGMESIRRMKSLRTVYVDGSEWPADEFWKKYDAGEFGKPLAQPQ